MKVIKLLVMSVACLSLSACNEDTVVSQSMWDGDTIVSTRAGDGSYTRTEYGTDWFGNKTTKVSKGHDQATHAGELLAMGAVVALVVVVKCMGGDI